MTIIRRANPFDELFTLRRAVDRLFDDDVFHPRTWRTVSLGAEPALDITTTPDELLVKASLPGWRPEDVELTLTGTTLTISGEMREEARRDDESWILNGIRRASFSRTLELPEGLVGDRASATYELGIPHAAHSEGRGSQAEADPDHGDQRCGPERELVGTGAAG